MKDFFISNFYIRKDKSPLIASAEGISEFIIIIMCD